MSKIRINILIGVAVDIDEWMILISTRINELNVVVDVEGYKHFRWPVMKVAKYFVDIDEYDVVHGQERE